MPLFAEGTAEFIIRACALKAPAAAWAIFPFSLSEFDSLTYLAEIESHFLSFLL